MHEPACACGNAARYINARGELCCAICPLKERVDSIRIADVPVLVRACRNLIGHDDRVIAANPGCKPAWQELRELLGKDVSR